MYPWIDFTWNTVKGECPHGCSYCYMHRWGKQKPVRFDEKELKTDLGSGNFIFVGSSCDMFANDIPEDWIIRTLEHCEKFDNKYLFQTKNPLRFLNINMPPNCIMCTTIESNRKYDLMCSSPEPLMRANAMHDISSCGMSVIITVEPILDFDIAEMVNIMRSVAPLQINIGADSGNNHLPEPPKEKILQLIHELEKFTVVQQKSNLKRLLK